MKDNKPSDFYLNDSDRTSPSDGSLTNLIQRLRNTPNWRRESFGGWKDCVTEYDRAPFEAADVLEAIAADRALNEQYHVVTTNAAIVKLRAQLEQEWVELKALKDAALNAADLDVMRQALGILQGLVERAEGVLALAAAPTPPAEQPAEPDQQLCRFYQAQTFPELVSAMELHIERLQAKLPRGEQPAFTRVREG